MVEVLTTALVSNVLVLGIIGFLSRNLVTHLLDKDKKNHENQLEIEKIRFQASFSWVYEKQALAVSELYDLFLELESMVNGGIYLENWNDYRRQLELLRSKYHKSRIFIPNELDELILNIIKIGIDIMGKSTSDPFCKNLSQDLRATKESALKEMRRLLSVAGVNS
ncbi:hypothetical protein ACFOSS_14045 [Pseudaeromonas sharmana]|uniref:Uncharacterized protein n=1 Tax=Pseudaeromonas sharmana TaxID=328412 RepID=A0ABV8CR27_9GAMM